MKEPPIYELDLPRIYFLSSRTYGFYMGSCSIKFAMSLYLRSRVLPIFQIGFCTAVSHPNGALLCITNHSGHTIHVTIGFLHRVSHGLLCTCTISTEDWILTHIGLGAQGINS